MLTRSRDFNTLNAYSGDAMLFALTLGVAILWMQSDGPDAKLIFYFVLWYVKPSFREPYARGVGPRCLVSANDIVEHPEASVDVAILFAVSFCAESENNVG